MKFVPHIPPIGVDGVHSISSILTIDGSHVVLVLNVIGPNDEHGKPTGTTLTAYMDVAELCKKGGVQPPVKFGYDADAELDAAIRGEQSTTP